MTVFRACALAILLATNVFGAEPVIYDWAIGEITNVSRSGRVITLMIETDQLQVSISYGTYFPAECTLAPGTLVRFRVRAPTWWSEGANVMQFYPATGETCYGLEKKFKFKVNGKSRTVRIREAEVGLLFESSNPFPSLAEMDREKQEAREQRWKEIAEDRGIPGDPATKDR